MFGKKKDTKAPAAANDGAVAAAKPAKPGFKDRPRPFGILRHESGKTAAVQKQADVERKSVDTKLGGLQTSLPGKLEKHTKELKEAGEQRIKLRKDTVDELTGEVAASKKLIAELQKRLADEQARLSRSQTGLKKATGELKSETAKVGKEFKVSHKAKKKELAKEVSDARKERKAVYTKTRRQLRGERWNTVKNTTKETLAVVPDLTMRFARASKRGICEVFSVFARTGRSMKKGFGEPTVFSVHREEPITKPKAPAKAKKAEAPAAKKPEQPKPPAPPAAG
ncbi:MAG: hypothetical protein GC185_13255 [Alphaproteobacteria bacterium]|nr:hypothetical protein [Alphaproteobacteria bacterium]